MPGFTSRALPWKSGLDWALSILGGRADIDIWEIANITMVTVTGGGGGPSVQRSKERGSVKRTGSEMRWRPGTWDVILVSSGTMAVRSFSRTTLTNSSRNSGTGWSPVNGSRSRKGRDKEKGL